MQDGDTVIFMNFRPDRARQMTRILSLIHILIAYHQLYAIYTDYDGVVNVKTINENAGKAPVQVDDRILSMLELARQMYDLTGGKINIAMGSVLGIWHDYREAAERNASEADNWQLRHMDKVLNLPFRDDVAKPNRDNAIDVYIGDTPEDVIGDDVWAETFTEQPEPLTAEEKKAYLSQVTGVCLGSDAFFPFGDNIERAHKSGVEYIAQPGGSIRDDHVIDTCNKYGIAMAFTGIRLFHH